MRIAYQAGKEVEAAIRRAGRTEDVQFSPDGTCLALACFAENRLLLLQVQVDGNEAARRITITGHCEVEAHWLRFPHGLSWADNRTLIVGNRYGEVVILVLPAEFSSSTTGFESIRSIGAELGDLVKTPGSLSIAPAGLGLFELLVCNNYVNHISRHLLDQRNDWAVVSNEIMLRDGLDVPDGVAHSPSGDWIAISNHGHRNVFMYHNDADLNPATGPHGILKGLGSGLIDHNQKQTVAAMTMADMKVCAHRS